MNALDFYNWRRRYSYTQKQAAQVLSVSVSAVKSWEAGRRNVPAITIALCGALGALANLMAAKNKSERAKATEKALKLF